MNKYQRVFLADFTAAGLITLQQLAPSIMIFDIDVVTLCRSYIYLSLCCHLLDYFL